MNAVVEKITHGIRDAFDLNLWVKNIKEHAPHVSAETMGWVAIVLLHLATIPTMIAILTGLTEKMPPVDMVLFSWVGLFCFFLKATIQKDLLNIVTIGFGFFVQAALLALIVFK
jgi:membrane protein YqaA with SNARE-associated domain